MIGLGPGPFSSLILLTGRVSFVFCSFRFAGRSCKGMLGAIESRLGELWPSGMGPGRGVSLVDGEG